MSFNTEKLLIQNVGPIDEFVIEPKSLTIVIGPQASGKSLFAQLLYFFRGIDFFLANNFNSNIRKEDHWEELALKQVLDDLRGIPFGYFANGCGKLIYHDTKTSNPLKLNVYNSNRRVRPLQHLLDRVRSLYAKWEADKNELRKSLRRTQIFIPTERSLYTQLTGRRESYLYSDMQPLTVREFSEIILRGQEIYKSIYARLRKNPQLPDRSTTFSIFSYIMEQQRKTLEGEAYIPPVGPREWKWRVDVGEKSKPLPIQATSSGQMEAWPFFVIAATFCSDTRSSYDIYFEEPETHLHPKAQIEIVKTICYLVSRGTKFVITTHSPFILYVINNYIQKFLATDQSTVGETSLDPKNVSAYCLGESPKDIVNPVTNLLDLNELDGIFDDISSEFDKYIEMELKNNA